jgi:hypothetical protein
MGWARAYGLPAERQFPVRQQMLRSLGAAPQQQTPLEKRIAEALAVAHGAALIVGPDDYGHVVEWQPCTKCWSPQNPSPLLEREEVMPDERRPERPAGMCLGCQYQNIDTAKFCTQCGSILPVVLTAGRSGICEACGFAPLTKRQRKRCLHAHDEAAAEREAKIVRTPRPEYANGGKWRCQHRQTWFTSPPDASHYRGGYPVRVPSIGFQDEDWLECRCGMDDETCRAESERASHPTPEEVAAMKAPTAFGCTILLWTPDGGMQGSVPLALWGDQ